MTASAAVALAMAVVCGCAGRGEYRGRAEVVAELRDRNCQTIAAEDHCEKTIPAGIDSQGGLTEDDAVQLALLNNAAFRELLVDLGLSEADVIQAGQLTNPDFSILFPTGVKQLEFTLNAPLEALWLRPRRTAMAHAESKRIADRLVQDGLNLVRDVHVAYTDAVLAEERSRLADDSAQLREQLAGLAESRQRAGTASELDVKTARIDALLEQEQSARLKHDLELARQRLRNILGMEFCNIETAPVGQRPLPGLEYDMEQLVAEALAVRPDLWSAQWAVDEAADKASLAEHDWFQVSGILPNLKSPGRGVGADVGPGMKFTVPLFNQNQGAIARAEAELAKAQRHCEAVREKVALEVRQAYTRYLQAQQDLERWDQEILPRLKEAVQMSAKAYENQNTSLLLMLENSRQKLTSELRRAEAAAELHRAAAELERSVGWRVLGVESRLQVPESQLLTPEMHAKEAVPPSGTEESSAAETAPVPEEMPVEEADFP